MSKLLEIVRKSIQSYQNRILVFDKDGVFDYPEIQADISSKGYEIVFIQSAYDFRIHFELNRSTDTSIVYVTTKLFPVLPDIRNKTKITNLGLRDIFPFLDPGALKGLSFPVLNILAGFKIYESLGYNETIKFILENIYNVDFDTLKTGKGKERLLNALITVFLEKNGVNKAVTEFLSQQVKPYFPDLVESGLTRSNLLAFVEAKWKAWVLQQENDINFDEFYLAKTIGYLFIKGQLKPVQVTKERYESFTTKVGVFYDQDQSVLDEFNILIEYLNNTITTIEDKPQEWFDLVQITARAKVLSFKCQKNNSTPDYGSVETRINERFQLFLETNYDSLISRSGSKHPYLVTRVLEFLRYHPSEKKALIVLDGLAYWQWLLIAERLQKDTIHTEPKSTFAWIPTITAWSRQAIFKGDIPNLDETNSNEENQFKAYWKKHGYVDHEVEYFKFGINKQVDVSSIHSRSVLAFVVNDLDDLMHGVLMGDEQLYLSTLQWVESNMLSSLIKNLRQAGFKIFITTDHGNIEATGIRSLKLNEKFGALSRSKRHIRFSNETLKNEFMKNNTSLPVGIKDLSVYLKDKSAFVPENDRLITHGGSHFWEVIIPFVEI
jgi:hypothetical protein